ncbi:protein TolR [Sphingomonas glaciei]|uniref:Protein TolR n=1 Tax=Sphingomonas glaciei TaxID=2938948 RepID=A0ABY5MR87_9SPHN|nr:protein TolR [Sphingomonas glaciei]UUR07003.1 protein TolR [Sphingomonas glaciei]
MGASVGNRRRGGRRAPMAEINVTPLVDVMLVLLIIFMVTAPLLVAGVPVDLPESRAAALDSQVKPVQISLDGEGRIFIDDTQVAEPALAQRLAAIAAEPAPEEGRRIYLRADRGLDYGRVMRVMGELNRAGLNRVALVSTAEGGQ